jgi:hypothetical protein
MSINIMGITKIDGIWGMCMTIKSEIIKSVLQLI